MYKLGEDEYEIEEYIDDPEGCETGSIIKSYMTEMTVTREEEINSGSAITEQEKEFLQETFENEQLPCPSKDIIIKRTLERINDE